MPPPFRLANADAMAAASPMPPIMMAFRAACLGSLSETAPTGSSPDRRRAVGQLVEPPMPLMGVWQRFQDAAARGR